MADFKNIQDCIEFVEAHMEVRYATSNGAYKAGRSITPDGDVNHSVGCAQPAVDVLFNLMNTADAGWGVTAIIGDFHKGDGRILVTLPLTCRPWGCGSGSKGSWNNTRIQWEVCEPAGHTYAGGTMVNYDIAKNATYFARMWKMLVAWNVYIVAKFGFPVSHIADHAESYKAGYGSNHSDMGQWLPRHGKSMDALRAEVAAIINYKEADDMTEKEVREIVTKMLRGEGSEVPSWAKNEMNEAVDLGITDGSRPLGYATRNEVALMVKRAVKGEKPLTYIWQFVVGKIKDAFGIK